MPSHRRRRGTVGEPPQPSPDNSTAAQATPGDLLPHPDAQPAPEPLPPSLGNSTAAQATPEPPRRSLRPPEPLPPSPTPPAPAPTPPALASPAHRPTKCRGPDGATAQPYGGEGLQETRRTEQLARQSSTGGSRDRKESARIGQLQ
eukprot:XP_020393635.1 extensin-like [Zea mays]